MNDNDDDGNGERGRLEIMKVIILMVYSSHIQQEGAG